MTNYWQNRDQNLISVLSSTVRCWSFSLDNVLQRSKSWKSHALFWEHALGVKCLHHYVISFAHFPTPALTAPWVGPRHCGYFPDGKTVTATGQFSAVPHYWMGIIKTFVSLKVKLTLVNREGFTLKWLPILTCMWTNAELGAQRSENYSPATSQLGLLIKPFFSWASTAPAPLAALPLCPGSNTLPLKPLEFWNDEGLTYANELTGGWVPVDSLRTGCGHQKDQGKIRELQLSAPPGPQCPGGVEGLEAGFSTRGNDLISHSCTMNLYYCIVLSSHSVVYNPTKGQGSTQLLGWWRRS